MLASNLDQVLKFENKDSITSDGTYYYAAIQDIGLFKIKIGEDGKNGEVIASNQNFSKTIVSLMYLNGKLYLRARVNPTKNRIKEKLPFLVINPETLKVIIPPTTPNGPI